MKLQIYYEYNFNSFDSKANKVTYIISYIKELVFEFVKTFLSDYRKEEKLYIKETNIIFRNIKYFFETLKVIYGKPYEKEV